MAAGGRGGAAERVVVLGDGWAALAAARALALAGASVTLLEPGPRPASAADLGALCAVPQSAPLLLALAQELGLAERVRLLPLELGPAAGVSGAGRLGAALHRPLEALRRRRLRGLLRHCEAWLDLARPERGQRLDDRSAADFARLYLGRGPLAAELLGALELAYAADPAELSRVVLMLALDAWGELPCAAALGLRELRAALLGELKGLRRPAALRGLDPAAGVLLLDSGERLPADALLLASCGAPAVSAWAALLGTRERLALAELDGADAIALRVRSPAPARAEPQRCVRAQLAPRGCALLAGIIDLTPLAEPPAELESGERDGGAAPAERPPGSEWLLRARPAAAARWAGEPDAWWQQGLLGEAAAHWPALFSAARVLRLERARLPQRRVGAFRSAARLAALGREHALPLWFADAACAGPHPEAELRAGLRAAEECLGALRAARD